MQFIAIDLGTSFIKGAVLDLDQLAIQHVQRLPFPSRISGLPDLFYEVDPAEIVATTRDLIASLLAQTNDCAGLVLCSQMHGLVLCDRAAQPLSNAITWQDQRVLLPATGNEESYFEQIQRCISPAQQAQLGNELKASLPLCFLRWMAVNDQLPRGDVIASSLPDFVLANLAGTQPVIEPTYAASQGALNLETLDWHQDVLVELGLDRVRWPDVRPFGDPVYEIVVEGQEIPCYAPVGDHQCSLVGAFLAPGELSLNISTGSQVSRLADTLEYGDYQTRPFFDGQYLNTLTRVPAGRALNHLVALLTELAAAEGVELADPWTHIAAAVAAQPRTDLSVNLAFFASEGGDRGSITQMHEHNLTVGHLFRAAFENMAELYELSARRLVDDPGAHRLVFSGGVAQKLAALREIIAARLDTDYRTCASSEDALLGLLALALVASGRASSVQAANQVLQARQTDMSRA